MDAEDTTDPQAPTDPALAWCPSGRADAPEAVVLGVRSRSDGTLTYLAQPVPAADVQSLIPDNIEPTRVLRFATHCVSSCAHRSGNDCTLISKIRTLPAAAESGLPRCHLRAHCKWWRQTGSAACGHCPAVATAVRSDDDVFVRVADPSVTPDQLREWIEANPDGPAAALASSPVHD
ncbi:hypothetical protein [Streptomyces sp. NPDC051569]|uniref:hypothetical protein n=1 Tax=Streptomyces sp. NPDC051569 TaxID=3365661 RepID=UPI0037A06504